MLEKKFERNLPTLERVFDFIAVFLTTHYIDEVAAYAINLAVEELFTNAVKYSTGNDEPIRLVLSAENNKIVVHFYDTGSQPYDITEATQVDLERPTVEIQPGGLGIHLIKSVMDDVTYDYRDNTNMITMVKILEGKDAGNQKEYGAISGLNLKQMT